MKKLCLSCLVLIYSSVSPAVMYTELTEGLHSYLLASAVPSSPKLSSSQKRQVPPVNRAPQSTARLDEIYQMLEQGEVEAAAVNLFLIDRSATSRIEKLHARYLLGQVLMKLGFDEAAAYQFVAVIKSGQNTYVDGSVESLTLAASNLGDDSKINYAVSRLKDNRYLAGRRDIFYFRRGELDMRRKDYVSAARRFSRVDQGSPFYLKAKYNEALAYARARKEGNALQAAERLLVITADREITDPTRVAAQLAKARIHYQKKNWQQAIETYRSVPRDSIFWHDTLFEQSWAYLMSGKFRSALSNFHSLHSPYYEKFYLPESLILRAIVYLYICNYEEVEKVVQLFDRLYTPLDDQLKSYLVRQKSYMGFYTDFTRYVNYWLTMQAGGDEPYTGPIPEVVARQLMKDGEMRKLFGYLETVRAESARLSEQSDFFRSSQLGGYLSQLLDRRVQKMEAVVGRRVRKLMMELRESLRGFIEQNGFLRFELINVQKTDLKKKMAGRSTKNTSRTIDEDEERDFYIQNGFNYWPFRGEYWLDEVGNYHYLGVQSCEK